MKLFHGGLIPVKEPKILSAEVISKVFNFGGMKKEAEGSF